MCAIFALVTDVGFALCVSREDIRQKMITKYINNPDYTYEKVNRASLACGPMVKWAIAQVSHLVISSHIVDCKTAVTPLLTHWSYHSRILNHRIKEWLYLPPSHYISNVDLLSIGPFGINFSKRQIETHNFHWTKYVWNFCLQNVHIKKILSTKCPY